jgi:hypothetical protein
VPQDPRPERQEMLKSSFSRDAWAGITARLPGSIP